MDGTRHGEFRQVGKSAGRETAVVAKSYHGLTRRFALYILPARQNKTGRDRSKCPWSIKDRLKAWSSRTLKSPLASTVNWAIKPEYKVRLKEQKRKRKAKITENMEKVYVGIDVSKEKLDVAILPFGEFIRFENSLEGLTKLKERLSSFSIFCIVFNLLHRH